jgi:lipid-A-disaccharide synthase
MPAAACNSPPAQLRIALVAGEASGDLLGADLIEDLRRLHPDAEFRGIGGPHMRAAGMQTWWDCSELAVMGLFEVLRHLPRLLRLRRELLLRLLDWQPDVFVGIDAPDFNLPVEKRLKQRGIRTAHYVSPSVWAWREKRAARIGESADRVICLFPMEPPIYARHGVSAEFVGHPLAEHFDIEPDHAAARSTLGLDPARTVLALLPGSRLGEIRHLAVDFIGAARIVAAQKPGIQIVAPMANAACREAFASILQAQSDAPPIQLLDGRARDALLAADVVLLASGTAALEALLAQRPMVVGYRISAVTHAIVKGLGMLRVDRFSLPNALAGDDLVPECMQARCTPEILARELLAWLDDAPRRAAAVTRFRQIHLQLRQDASARAAAVVDQLLSSAVATRA